MSQNILKLFIEKGFLLDQEMFNFLNELGNEEIANEIIDKIASISKKKLITKTLVNENLEKIKPILFELNNEKKKLVEKFFVNISILVEVKKESIIDSKGILENKPLIKILSSPVLASQKLEVKDFVKHFRNRFLFIKSLLQQKPELENLISIDKIIGNSRNFSIIGIVTSKNLTKNKNEIYSLFISDIHIGSKNFLETSFQNFINWLNGENCTEPQKQLLKKIKYIFVVGDTIDGVGVYPGQEKDLAIKDITQQYEKLADFYKQIPQHISIIHCAGQHDAVRVAEPQPPIGTDFGYALHQIPNLFLVSNPSLIEIESQNEKSGIKILMYHGASMHPIMGEIEELRLINGHHYPAKVVKHLLLRRHLAPSHGDMVYIPHAIDDPLLIKEVPDIITTADLHRTDIDNYNGVLIICNSCWQSITAFEEKVGNIPDPCKVPILNLKTREIKILDFTEPEGLEDNKEINCQQGKEVKNA